MQRRDLLWSALLAFLGVWAVSNVAAWATLRRGSRDPRFAPSTAAFPDAMLPLRPSDFADGAVDVLFTWVNGTDPAHIAAYERAAGRKMTAQAMRRFRDYGLLRFAVRSVERHAPWVRRVVLVTSGQVPTWFNESSTRGAIVTHAQIFSAEAQAAGALPTFSSNAIEANLWNVPGLSELFVYMNDDMFLWRNTPLVGKLVDKKSGRMLLDMDSFQAPERKAAMHNIWHRSVMHSNELLNCRFHPGKHATKHNYAGHCGYIMRSSILKKMAEWWKGDFEKTSRNKWRNGEDTALPFLHHNTALELGVAEKKPFLRLERWYVGSSWTENSTNNDATWKRIQRSEANCVCLQDGFGEPIELVEAEIRRLEGLLCSVFPDKSSLEKADDPNPCDAWNH